MAAGLDKSNGNLSVVVIFTSAACFYNYTLTLEKILNFMILCILDSIGRGSSHNIKVGPHAHDSKNHSLHHCQGKF